MPDSGQIYVNKTTRERRRWRLSPGWLSLLPLGLLAAGCPSGGSLEDPERFVGGGEEACDAVPIFEEKCAGGLCHSEDESGPPAGGTDLTSPGVGARLLDAPATYEGVGDPENCPDPAERLVDSDDIEKSLLLTKLLGTHSCGDAMPVPNPPAQLDDAAIDCIRSWMRGVVQTGGGTPGTGGSGMGGASNPDMMTTGGSTNMTDPDPDPDPSDPMELVIQAECAFGGATGDCGNTFDGTQMGTELEAGNMVVGYIDGGDYLQFPGVDFQGFNQATLFLANGGTDEAGTIELRRGSVDGTLIVSHTVESTGAWDTFQEVTVTFDAQTGQDDLYFVGVGTAMGILNIDYIQFSVQ